MMLRWLGLIAVLALVVLQTGCPYESKTPLGNPSGSLDPRLVGSWVQIDDPAAATVRVLVLPFNASECYVEVHEKDAEPSRYRAYPVLVGDQTLLNINELKPEGEPGEFVFARYTFLEGGNLSVRFIAEKGVSASLANDRAALTDFLAAHLNDPALDDPETDLLFRRSPAVQVHE
jgi:hypothetical protein